MKVDVAIVGSGFAGSFCALVLRRLGRTVAVIDRARHPRFAIGESSTPAANLVLRALCDRYDLTALRPLTNYGTWKAAYPRLGVGRKRGFSYFQHVAGEAFVPHAGHSNELLVTASPSDERSDTQWLRADVDTFFATQVREAGIPLLEDTDVHSIRSDTRWEIEAVQSGRPRRLDASFLIDATGPGGLLARALDLPNATETLHTRSRALFGHFWGLPRWDSSFASADHPFACDDAALHHLIDEGWMWWIRFDTGLTSAGFVFDERRHPIDPSRTAESEWAATHAQYPSLSDAFSRAALADPPGRLIRTGRLQRLVGQVAGARWALLPHAAGFVDPLHSTGIAHTLLGIERLARIVETHWGRPSIEEALAGYDRSVREEIQHVDRIVDAGYAALGSFRLFAAVAMLYFAAAIMYEERRIAAGIEDDGFLMAHDPAWRGIVAEFHRRLRDTPERDESTVGAFERAIEAAIRPYNSVGLFAPAVQNMYTYTAAVF
jgi:FADH2 O2-dependent halogenase